MRRPLPGEMTEAQPGGLPTGVLAPGGLAEQVRVLPRPPSVALPQDASGTACSSSVTQQTT